MLMMNSCQFASMLEEARSSHVLVYIGANNILEVETGIGAFIESVFCTSEM